jgi:hypothetical protein
MLPSRALLLIHDYSRPMTRPNWRKSKPIITTYRLYTILQKCKRNYKPKYLMVFNNIEDTDWYYTCQYIKKNGLEIYYLEYFRQYGVKYDSIIHNVEAIDGVTDAIHTFNWLNKY